MAIFYSICSSSKGCATYIQGNKGKGILIDAGLSFSSLKKSLNNISIDIESLSAIFITHEHSDHIKGLKSIINNINIPVYSALETINFIKQKYDFAENINFQSIDNEILIYDIIVNCFDVPHDASSPYGYVISLHKGKKIGICTDLGHITSNVYNNLVDCDIILLESNYDYSMLYNNIKYPTFIKNRIDSKLGHLSNDDVYNNLVDCDIILLESNYDYSMLYNNIKYPTFIKNRIDSKLGHLSNDDCSDVMIRLIKKSSKRFCIGHISTDNNTPEIVMNHILNKLSLFNINLNRDYLLDILPQYNKSGSFIEV